MATSEHILDWPRLLGELSLNRTAAQFTETVERLAQELGAREVRFHLYEMDAAQLVRGHERLKVDPSTLQGTCALYCEPVETPEGSAWPVTRFGSLIGVLSAAQGRLGELAGAAGLMFEPVRIREEAATCLAALQGLLTAAVDRVAPGSTGHVARVARLALELGSMLDLSPQARQDLWDAAHFHDVGWLLLQHQSYEEQLAGHSEAGAGFLEQTEALRLLSPLVENHHQTYPASKPVAMEAWILALAEELDELFSEHPGPLEEKTRDFYSSHAGKHNPEVVDALSSLIDSGRLQELYS